MKLIFKDPGGHLANSDVQLIILSHILLIVLTFKENLQKALLRKLNILRVMHDSDL